jgi:hypothetical protein
VAARNAMLFVSLLGIAGLRGPGCGGDDHEHGVNAPCTRPKDCAPPLLCVSGVCEEPDADAAPDVAPPGDAETDAGDAGDG